MAIQRTIQSNHLPGHDITVTITLIQHNPVVYEVKASAGQTSYTERHTIGADGIGPVMDQPTLRSQVIGYAQGVADKVAWQENMRLLNEQLGTL